MSKKNVQKKIYQCIFFSSCNNSNIIYYDEKDELETLGYTLKHSGNDLSKIRHYLNSQSLSDNPTNVNKAIKDFYEAFRYLNQNYFDNPIYRQTIILEKGTCAAFNNYRAMHSRSGIHPQTKRELSLGYLDNQVYYNKWRIINGFKSGLDDKWLLGCTQQHLEILANRFI